MYFAIFFPQKCALLILMFFILNVKQRSCVKQFYRVVLVVLEPSQNLMALISSYRLVNDFIGTTDARVACSFVYSAIFQLTSPKFQTFAYNLKTVGSGFMKFLQQFEIIELYVCTKFRGNRSRDFGFRTRKPPRKFGVKRGLSQKRLKYGKNISYGCMS